MQVPSYTVPAPGPDEDAGMIAIASASTAPRLWYAWLLVIGLSWMGATAGAARSQVLPTPPQRTLSVAVLSLAGGRDLWSEHRNDVLALLKHLHPDVIALRDVVQTAEMSNQASWLAARLGYSCDFITADPPSHMLRVGNALLTRLSVRSDALTLLQPAELAGTAGMIQLVVDGTVLDVYLPRLYPGDLQQADDEVAAIRAAQLHDLKHWIKAISGTTPTLVIGQSEGIAATASVHPLQSSDPMLNTAMTVTPPLQVRIMRSVALPNAGTPSLSLAIIALPAAPLKATRPH